MSKLLTIELVPESLWEKNLRTLLSSKEWDYYRRKCYQDAGYVCEICGGVGNNHPVECHERWQYNDSNKTQTLIGFIALCPNCHMVKHIGRTRAIGREEEAINHMHNINKWSYDKVTRHIKYSFRMWELRNLHQWSQNLDYIKNKNQPTLAMERKTMEEPENKQELIARAQEIAIIVNDDDYKKARSVHKRLKAAVDFIAGKFEVQKREANKRYTDYLAEEKKILGDIPKLKKAAKAQYDQLLKDEKAEIGTLKSWRNSIDTKLKSWRQTEKDRKAKEEKEAADKIAAELKALKEAAESVENGSENQEAELVAKEENAAGASGSDGENKVIDVHTGDVEEEYFCEIHNRKYPAYYGVCPDCAQKVNTRSPSRPEDKAIVHTTEEVKQALQEEIQKKTGQRETAKGATETEQQAGAEVPAYTINITNLSEFIDFGVNSKKAKIKVFAGQCIEFRRFMEKELKRREWKEGDKLPPGIEVILLNPEPID